MSSTPVASTHRLSVRWCSSIGCRSATPRIRRARGRCPGSAMIRRAGLSPGRRQLRPRSVVPAARRRARLAEPRARRRARRDRARCGHRRDCRLSRRLDRQRADADGGLRHRAACHLRRARAPRDDAAGAGREHDFRADGWHLHARRLAFRRPWRRGIVAAEREQEYVVAARSLGASSWRIIGRHLLPACGAHLVVQGTLLLPAFVLAEATLSFVGLGFPQRIPTWGTMLRDAATVSMLTRFPWLLAPAVAIFAVVLA